MRARYFRMGRLAEGLAEVDRILAAGWATSAHTYNTRGHILEALGRRGEAVVDLQKALSLDPGKRLRQQIVAALARLGD
jgi:predicted RNA polymerase sigma factor